MKPTLKPPGTKRFNLKYDESLSSSPFKFKLCRYTKEYLKTKAAYINWMAGVYTRPLFSST